MTVRQLVRDGMRLRIDDIGGVGRPVVLQHGLCGDALQTAEVFPDDGRLRRITLECRGHGRSEAGDPASFSIATFADDVAAMIEALGTGPLVLGGISMGAAIALRLAVRRPELVAGLVLARPAWVTFAAPENLSPNLEVGRLLERLPREEARRLFEESETARRLSTEAPDNLATLLGLFDRDPQHVTAALLNAISLDGPGVSPEEVRALRVPTLVIATARDAIHPLGFAHALAGMIPSAEIVEITSKGDDRARYAAEFRTALSDFALELRE